MKVPGRGEEVARWVPFGQCASMGSCPALHLLFSGRRAGARAAPELPGMAQEDLGPLDQQRRRVKTH